MKKLKYVLLSAAIIVAAGLFFKIFPFIVPAKALLAETDFSSAVYDKNGNLLRLSLSNDSAYRVRVRLEDISAKAVEAVLLYEDKWFYYHFGFNPASLARAAVSFLRGDSRPFGASTITMQLIRIKYGLNTKTVSGKLKQIILAVYTEALHGKDEILEAYFNLAPYGHNVEGIEAASLIYFKTASKNLTVVEALNLAVIPQNPSGRTPTNDSGAKNLFNATGRLFDLWLKRHVSDSTYSALFDMKVNVWGIPDLPFYAPHLSSAAVKIPGKERISLSIDMKYQEIVEKRTGVFIKRFASLGISNASVILVNYKTMETEAYVGSVDFFNGSIQGQVDGIRAKRSPGSALKPFIYALALEQGLIHPKSMLKDAPRRYGSYSPENADRGFMGPLFASEALVYSRNIPAIDLLNRLERSSFYNLLKKAGITGLKEEAYYGSALAIGGFETAAVEVASLYCALANLGNKRNIKFFAEDDPGEGERLFSREAAFLVLDMLSGNPKPYGYENLGTVYWKTGTSFAFRDAWSAGIFGDYVLVVWVGNFNGEGNSAFTGRGAAAPLFFSIASGIKNFKNASFEPIRPATNMNVAQVDICSPTGDLPGRFCPRTEKGWFIPGVSPVKVTDVYRQIEIDAETGLRACEPVEGKTYKTVYEFWPSDIYALFLKSGIHKPRPPVYMPGCDIENVSSYRTPPAIETPSNGTVYGLAAGVVGEKTIPFSASADSGSEKIYWFLNGRFVGESAPSEIFFWRGVPGQYRLTATDDKGKSAVSYFTVEIR